MGGMSLDNLASQDELDTLKQIDGMTHEPGFESVQGGDSLEDLGFSSLDDMTGGGDLSAGLDGFENSLEQQQQQAAVNARPNWGDIAIETTGKGLKATGILFKELVVSLRARTANDVGYLGHNLLIAGIPMVILSIFMFIMAGPTGWKGFGFFGLGGIFLLSGISTSALGAIFMGIATEFVQQGTESPEQALENLPETEDNAVVDYVENIEDSVDNVVTDDLLNELDDILGGDDTAQMGYATNDYASSSVVEDIVDIPQMPNFDELDSQISAGTTTRKNLLTTFIPYFMLRTPDYKEVKELLPETQEYASIRATIIKAIANLQNTTIDKVIQKCISIKDTFFSYKVVFERVKKMKKLTDLENELEIYFRAALDVSGLDEEEINNLRLRIKVTVVAVGDVWEITINKGITGIITMGDVLKGQREYDYFRDEKHILPYIAGITEGGSVIMDDAANSLQLMITGKQRSGKSWYVVSILASLLTFNSPEDIAMIIVDPKNSTIFNTLSLFPHVIGLHKGDNINAIFREIIDVEAVKREEILKEARCETIKDYNKAHPMQKLPYLFIVVDEVLSVKDSLAQLRVGEKDADAKARVKEFQSSLLVILSKLPYIGIGIMFVPHRATGVIDKTARTLIKLKSAVMADADEIEETLGEKVDHRLLAPGDMAMRTTGMPAAKYVRGPAVADSDETTIETLRRIAKGFYSLGVDLPNWKYLKTCFTRDEEYIHKELFGDTEKIKY